MSDDWIHMARALQLAAQGMNTTDPNPRVGCVLVREGRVVGEGWHVRAGEPHAEIHALKSAGVDARGATAFVSLEPCSHTGRTPPCADALIAAGIGRVVCATVDPNPSVAGDGIRRLTAAGIAVTEGILAAEARALNPGFFSRFERGRPFVRLKLAMSLDGRTAPPGGGRACITDEASREDVQCWRARSSAVVTGSGTVRIDNPRLDVRLTYGPWVRQPLRVVLDSDADCSAESTVFKDGNAVVFTAMDAPDPWASRLPIQRVPRSARGLDLGAVVARLAALEMNEVLVECGARLAAGFIEANLVDELIVYVAPHLLGADAAPFAALEGLGIGRPLPAFEFKDQRRIRDDIRWVLAPRRV